MDAATTAYAFLALGFLLGIRHATDADHLAAVATLATQESTLSGTVRQGIAWGVGHAMTLAALGGAVLLVREEISPSLSRFLEIAVGVMLVALGADVIRRAMRNRAAPVASRGASHRAIPLRAVVVGVVHGLAGTAAMVMLSLGAAQSFATGLAYIVLFGTGSIAGMAMLSLAIAVPLRLSASTRSQLGVVHKVLIALVGAWSCALGGFTVYTNAAAAGLF